MMKFLQGLLARFTSSPKTTVGGGALGLAFAGLISMLEEQTGCHFAVAFGNIDWAQIAGYVIMQGFGLIATDANTTLVTKGSEVVSVKHPDVIPMSQQTDVPKV